MGRFRCSPLNGKPAKEAASLTTKTKAAQDGTLSRKKSPAAVPDFQFPRTSRANPQLLGKWLSVAGPGRQNGKRSEILVRNRTLT